MDGDFPFALSSHQLAEIPAATSLDRGSLLPHEEAAFQPFLSGTVQL